jgi:hypothetical protein
MSTSKPLSHDDESGFHFVKELLSGEPTYAINFDPLQQHPKYGYIIFEFLLCEEAQVVTPRTSHPNKYWHKNSRKFISLWRAAQDINAILYLVNYAKVGTAHADEVTAIRVHGIDESKGIIKEEKKDFTRLEFAAWFRKLNSECK